MHSDLYYISPSVIPSRSANSVHVIQMCNAFAQLGLRVTLFAKRSVLAEDVLLLSLRQSYGVELKNVRVISFFGSNGRGANIRIATMALRHLWSWKEKAGLLVSRNLYASFFLGVLLKRPLVFETHQLEYGLRKNMQRAIMTRPWISTVAISKELVKFLAIHHGVRPCQPLVLHDAAPDGVTPLPDGERIAILNDVISTSLSNWQAVCGYFGHLYPGRGTEIIEAMAAERPRVLFLIYGGNDADVRAHNDGNLLSNIHYKGHVPHPEAQKVMRAVDILLMPYQESVSIGVAGHDTAKWMSPMKMFEYMSSGVPLVASDLPVLREVLEDGENALLVPPSDHHAWISAVDRLLKDKTLANNIATRAYEGYKENYTWTQRARRILESAGKL